MRLSVLLLVAALLAGAAERGVKLTQHIDRIAVDIDGKPFTAFFTSAEYTKPFLHPLRSASGAIVSRSFPMDLVEGESRDHPHQRGLWFTHGDVNGYDFWANEATQKGATPKGRGKVVLRKILNLTSGKKSGTVAAVFEWQTLGGETLLTETRRMVFYSDPALRTIDFDITLSPAVAVTFGDTKEGTFAIRLATELEEPQKNLKGRTGKMVNAEGAQTEQNVWGKRSPWVDYSGEVKGERVGVAIFDHPTNPRHPTYWHSRSYGLFAANIFGVHDFERDRNRNESLTVQPGQTLRFRYRVVIHPGDLQAGIAQLYKKYASTK